MAKGKPSCPMHSTTVRAEECKRFAIDGQWYRIYLCSACDTNCRSDLYRWANMAEPVDGPYDHTLEVDRSAARAYGKVEVPRELTVVAVKPSTDVVTAAEAVEMAEELYIEPEWAARAYGELDRRLTELGWAISRHALFRFFQREVTLDEITIALTLPERRVPAEEGCVNLWHNNLRLTVNPAMKLIVTIAYRGRDYWLEDRKAS